MKRLFEVQVKAGPNSDETALNKGYSSYHWGYADGSSLNVIAATGDEAIAKVKARIEREAKKSKRKLVNLRTVRLKYVCNIDIG